MRKLTTFLFAMLCMFALKAQSLELGLYGGVSAYHGDLTPGQFSVKGETIHPAGGLFLRLSPTEKLAFRLSLLQMKVSGDDALYEVSRGLRFESDITEAALVIELQPFQLQLGNTTLRPYAFVGAAVFRFNPMTTYGNLTLELQPLGTEGQGLPGYPEPYTLSQAAIPVGGGIKWQTGDRWTIGLEYGGRKLFTDYLDDVGSQVINYGDLVSGKDEVTAFLSNPNLDPASDDLSQTYRRGGAESDWYSSLGLTLAYRLGGGDGSSRRSGKAARCYQF